MLLFCLEKKTEMKKKKGSFMFCCYFSLELTVLVVQSRTPRSALPQDCLLVDSIHHDFVL